MYIDITLALSSACDTINHPPPLCIKLYYIEINVNVIKSMTYFITNEYVQLMPTYYPHANTAHVSAYFERSSSNLYFSQSIHLILPLPYRGAFFVTYHSTTCMLIHVNSTGTVVLTFRRPIPQYHSTTVPFEFTCIRIQVGLWYVGAFFLTYHSPIVALEFIYISIQVGLWYYGTIRKTLANFILWYCGTLQKMHPKSICSKLRRRLSSIYYHYSVFIYTY